MIYIRKEADKYYVGEDGPYDTLEQAEAHKATLKQPVEKAGSGLIVMLHLPVEDAIKIAPANGESVEMLHITLAYMGKQETLTDGAFDKVTEAVERVCRDYSEPLKGCIGGVGRFNASDSSDGMDVVYASFDCPEIVDFRQAIVHAIEREGVAVRKNHGYIPHVTLKYVYPFDENPLPRVATTPLTFDQVTVAMAGETRHVPIGGKRDPYLDLPSDADRLAHLGVPGSLVTELARMDESRLIALKLLGLSVIEKSDDESDDTRAKVKILKTDPERRLVYGIVLRPLQIDNQGHVMTAADVEYAAHHFLGSNGVMAIRHRAFADAVCVESFIAPCDFELNGAQVLAGDWVLVSYVRDDELWSKIVEGEYQGYSVGGFGKLATVK